MKTLLLLMLCITTGHLVIAQDTITFKMENRLAARLSACYGIRLLIAEDTMNYKADEVASIIFCNENRNCPNSDGNSKSSYFNVTGEKPYANPCNGLPKQQESTNKRLRKPIGSRNNKY